MKTIQLTKGFVAIVDDEDFVRLCHWRWFAHTCTSKRVTQQVYASGYMVQIFGSKKKLLMHRVIMDAQRGQFIDHIDGNGLNNQKSNLRFSTRSQNAANRQSKTANRSGYTGVYARRNGFKCQMKVGQKNIHIGDFKTKDEAALAYNEAALKYHGEFAKLNVVPSTI